MMGTIRLLFGGAPSKPRICKKGDLALFWRNSVMTHDRCLDGLIGRAVIKCGDLYMEHGEWFWYAAEPVPCPHSKSGCTFVAFADQDLRPFPPEKDVRDMDAKNDQDELVKAIDELVRDIPVTRP